MPPSNTSAPHPDIPPPKHCAAYPSCVICVRVSAENGEVRFVMPCSTVNPTGSSNHTAGIDRALPHIAAPPLCTEEADVRNARSRRPPGPGSRPPFFCFSKGNFMKKSVEEHPARLTPTFLLPGEILCIDLISGGMRVRHDSTHHREYRSP